MKNKKQERKTTGMSMTALRQFKETPRFLLPLLNEVEENISCEVSFKLQWDSMDETVRAEVNETLECWNEIKHYCSAAEKCIYESVMHMAMYMVDVEMWLRFWNIIMVEFGPMQMHGVEVI